MIYAQPHKIGSAFQGMTNPCGVTLGGSIRTGAEALGAMQVCPQQVYRGQVSQKQVVAGIMKMPSTSNQNAGPPRRFPPT